MDDVIEVMARAVAVEEAWSPCAECSGAGSEPDIGFWCRACDGKGAVPDADLADDLADHYEWTMRIALAAALSHVPDKVCPQCDGAELVDGWPLPEQGDAITAPMTAENQNPQVRHRCPDCTNGRVPDLAAPRLRLVRQVGKQVREVGTYRACFIYFGIAPVFLEVVVPGGDAPDVEEMANG